MEARIYAVPTLQDLCFDTFYKQLLCKVTPATVEFIRNCIYHQLMGSMRKTIRERCIENLACNYFMPRPIKESVRSKNRKEEVMFMLDICTILDCVLDPSFSELDITVPNSAIKLFPVMVSVISRRSPELAKLEVEFTTILYDDGSGTETTLKIEVMPAVTARPTQSDNTILPNLTSLEICHSLHLHYENNGGSELTVICRDWIPLHDVDKPHQSILSTVAKCCPALTDLLISGFHLRKLDFFALLLGEWNDVLFPIECDRFSDDSVLKCLKIPSEFLSPLCFTLKELFLMQPEEPTPSFATYALVMRHLSKLESTCKSKLDMAQILKLIHEMKEWQTKQAEFEEFCRESALRTGRKRKLSGPFYFLSDQLSLTKLDNVLIEDVDTLRTIGSICPNLQEVEFISTSLISESHPDEVEAILKNWPKVVAISIFEDVDSAYVQSILRALGPNLKSIEFVSCTQLDLHLFNFCPMLKRLILQNCSFKPRVRSNTYSGSFLPVLETLDSDTCLELWAPLFEDKRTLTDLTLNCCHIGTGARLPRLEWSRMTEFWQRLERLELQQSTGLTTAILSDLLPQLNGLKWVLLPKSINEKEPELCDKMIQGFSKRYKMMQFYCISGFNSCAYQQRQ